MAKANEKLEDSKVKPLKERNPKRAALKMQLMCDNSKARRQDWINKINLEDDQF